MSQNKTFAENSKKEKFQNMMGNQDFFPFGRYFKKCKKKGKQTLKIYPCLLEAKSGASFARQ
jgi:hypothetical protein